MDRKVQVCEGGVVEITEPITRTTSLDEVNSQIAKIRESIAFYQTKLQQQLDLKAQIEEQI